MWFVLAELAALGGVSVPSVGAPQWRLRIASEAYAENKFTKINPHSLPTDFTFNIPETVVLGIQFFPTACRAGKAAQ